MDRFSNRKAIRICINEGNFGVDSRMQGNASVAALLIAITALTFLPLGCAFNRNDERAVLESWRSVDSGIESRWVPLHLFYILVAQRMTAETLPPPSLDLRKRFVAFYEEFSKTRTEVKRLVSNLESDPKSIDKNKAVLELALKKADSVLKQSDKVLQEIVDFTEKVEEKYELEHKR